LGQGFEVGFGFFARALVVRQVAVQQAQQRAGCVHGAAVKHAQVHLVVGHHIQAIAHAHQAAGRTQVRHTTGVVCRIKR